MTDQNSYTSEFKILPAVWYHESGKDIPGMRWLKNDYEIDLMVSLKTFVLLKVIMEEFRNFPEDWLKAINNQTFQQMHLCVEKGILQVEYYDK